MAASVGIRTDRPFSHEAQRIQPDAFRQVLRNVPVPVAVLTTALGDRRDGITISSFMTVALEPPLLAVSLARDKPATSLALEAKCFAFNLLGAQDSTLADRFSAHHSLPRFDGISTELGPRGLPTLIDAIAVLYADIVAVQEAGDHVLITGEVFDFLHKDGVPLIRHRSGYTEPVVP